MMCISRKYTFEAAHSIPVFDEGHRCRAVHGHSYVLKVTWRLRGDDPIPFEEVDPVVRQVVIERLDHSTWNEVVPDGTLEKLAPWIWHELEIAFTRSFGSRAELQRIDLDEGPHSCIAIEA